MWRNPAMECVFVAASCLGIVVLAAAAQPPAENQPKGTVRGIVAGEDGKPVAGARVWAYHLSHYEPIDPLRPAVDVTTDAEGRFRVDLAPGEYTASAAKGALVAAERVWRAQRWQIEASKPVEVHIRLRNAVGEDKDGFVTGPERLPPRPEALNVVQGDPALQAGQSGKTRAGECSALELNDHLAA